MRRTEKRACEELVKLMEKGVSTKDLMHTVIIITEQMKYSQPRLCKQLLDTYNYYNDREHLD